MITRNKLIYDIRERLKLHVDDQKITDAYLAHEIDVFRAFIIKQRLGDIRRIVSPNYKQEIILTMEIHSNAEEYFDSTIARSTVKVPFILDINANENRTVLYNGNKLMHSFQLVPIQRLPYVGTRSFMQDYIYGAIGQDHKLYLNSGGSLDKDIESIRLWGIFENPEDAWKLSEDYSASTDFDDVEYPIDVAVISGVIDLVLSKLATIYQIPSDKINNANDDSQP